MGVTFIEKNYNSRFLSAQGYIDEFYGDRTNISQTEYISTPYVSKTIDYLFSGFTAMTYIDLPNCTSLAYKTFYGCSKLKSMYLPNVEYVKSNAFEKCSSLKNITLSKCIYMEDSIFDDCDLLEEINLPILSSTSTGICIQNLSNLESINMPMVSGGIILKNLQNLGTCNLDSLEYIGDIPGSELLPTYFENLPDIAFIELSNVKAVGQSAFRSLPILNSISLQTCSIIYSNVFAEDSSEYSLPGSVQFSLPSVTSFDFVSNAIFSSITLPAVTNFSTFYTTPLYQTNVYPYYIGLPNISQINGPVNLFDYVGQTLSTTFTHDLIIDLPSLTEIGSSIFYVGGGYSYVGSNGVIFKVSNLSTIGSYAFYNIQFLKEIDLINTSVLEEFVFANTYDYNNLSYSGLDLKNISNIQVVKRGAFSNIKLKSDTLNLPNCISFDFRQNGPSTYDIDSIRYYDSDATVSDYYPGKGYKIVNLLLPSLSEIIIDPNNGPKSFAAMNIFPTELFDLENCEQIIFNDGSDFYANGTLPELYSRTCNTLYIPNCSTLRYSYNESINISYRNLLLDVRQVYAPSLTTLENILFRNLDDLNCDISLLSILNLEYTYGKVSEISYIHSFSGLIDFKNYSDYFYYGSRILSNIYVPGFSGMFYFNPNSTWSNYIGLNLDITLGSVEKANIDITNVDDFYSTGYNTCNVSLNSLSINNDISLSYIPQYSNVERTINWNLGNCKNIDYTTWSTSMILYSESLDYKGLDNYSEQFDWYSSCGTIFSLGGFLSASELKSITIHVSYASLVNSNYLEPIQYILDKETNTWTEMTWYGLTSFYGKYIWNDGTDIYYSNGEIQYILDKNTNTWTEMTWTGLTEFSGEYIWHDETNVYYSNDLIQYVLDIENHNWVSKSYFIPDNFSRANVWTDGTDTYYSDGEIQYILDKNTNQWVNMEWHGLTNFNAIDIWTDGDNIYYSYNNNQYILNKNISTWSIMTWKGLISFRGRYIWTDGNDIYYSYDDDQYYLNKALKRWYEKTWIGLTEFSGEYIWTDGNDIYYSNYRSSTVYQYMLIKNTNSWKTVDTWENNFFRPNSIWADSTNIIYRKVGDNKQCVLNKSRMVWTIDTLGIMGYNVWTDGENIYYSNDIDQYILNKSSNTWSNMLWNGVLKDFVGLTGLPYDFRLGSAVVYNNEIHILGGYNNDTNHYKWNGTEWISVSTLPYRFYYGSAVTYNNEIHILGSSVSDNRTKHYKWNGTSWTEASTLPYDFYIGSAVVYNNEIHILGGYNNDTNHYKWNGTSWTEASTLPYAFSYGSAVVYNNEIHILGGPTSSAKKNHSKWNSISQQWEILDELPYDINRSVVVLNDEFYILYEYKICKWNDENWTDVSISPYPYDFSYGLAVVYNNDIYILGGDFSDQTYFYRLNNQINSFYGRYIWTDGNDIYYSREYQQCILDKETNTWNVITWNGSSSSSFTGDNIWTDGDNIYYSNGSSRQYILDKNTNTWSSITWYSYDGYKSFEGRYIWTNGDTIYYSYTNRQYYFNKKVKGWYVKTWTGLTSFDGSNIWTDGDNIYYSYNNSQYILDKNTSTWSSMTWYGLTRFSGVYIWTDGDNIYYSNFSIDSSSGAVTNQQYILDKNTNTWYVMKTIPNIDNFNPLYVWHNVNVYYSDSENHIQYLLNNNLWDTMTWSGITNFASKYIWTDGTNIYYSYDSNQYVLDEEPFTWTEMTWIGLVNFDGNNVWTDGTDMYYSDDEIHYILDNQNNTWSITTWNGLTEFNGCDIWIDDGNVYYSYNDKQYTLDISTHTWSEMIWNGLDKFHKDYIWSDGDDTYCSFDGAKYNLEDKQIDLPYMSKLYAPELNNINISFPSEMQSNITYINPYISIPNIKELTLGLSTLSNLINLSLYSMLTLSKMTYISMSNLESIPYNYMLNLPNVTQANFDKLIYIGGGLSLPSLSQLNFNSNLSYINYLNISKLDSTYLEFINLLSFNNIVFNYSVLSSISIPNIISLPSNAFYSCTNMSELILPSNCSFIGMNAFPSNVRLVELRYSSYNKWFANPYNFIYLSSYSSNITRQIVVPSSLYDQYWMSGSGPWGSISSYRWRLISGDF